jgi:glycosyltransferase involved in cell wall biosynthesis
MAMMKDQTVGEPLGDEIELEMREGKRESEMIESDRPLISIGMLTKNRAWCIQRVLDAIGKTNYPKKSMKLVVVDDFSDDETWEMLEDWKARNINHFHDIQLIQEHSNIPEARNICVRNIEGSYVLFWDSDVIPPTHDFLAEIVEMMEGSPDIGAVGCSYEYENPGLLTRAKKAPVSRLTHAVFLGFTLVKREAVDGTGNFNERMLVGEDTEFFIRMRERTNYKIMWGPEPVLHLRSPGAATTAPGSFRRLMKYTNRDRATGYFREFSNLPVFLRIRVVYYLSLPIFWLVVALMLIFGVIDVWVTIGLIVLSFVPSLASAVRNSGLRCGMVTAITFYIPTGIALSYGVLREAVKASFRPSQS